VKVVRKAYICKFCEGVYADAKVTECDCLVGQEQEWFVGEINYDDGK
jgi:hypothetical protein